MKLKTPNYSRRICIAIKIEIYLRKKLKQALIKDKNNKEAFCPLTVGVLHSVSQYMPKTKVNEILLDWNRDEETFAQYVQQVKRQLASEELLPDFPLMLCVKYIKRSLPEDSLLVRHTVNQYQTLVGVPAEALRREREIEDAEYDEELAADGFNSWSDYTDWELDRVMDEPD